MIIVRPMYARDVPAVMVVNERCFTMPWAEWVLRMEVTENQNAYWVLIEEVQQPARPAGLRGLLWRGTIQKRVIGFGGFWLLRGEAHISNIGVDPDYRGQGLGELLLIAMLQRAIQLDADWSRLEVRVSNSVAIRLYEKYRFVLIGRARGYYRDNNEDAYQMGVRPLDENYNQFLDHNAALLAQRLQWQDYFTGRGHET